MKKQAQAKKIKLVVTDGIGQPPLSDDSAHSYTAQPCSSTAAGESVIATECDAHDVIPTAISEPATEHLIDITEVDKLMKEAPLDEFFRVLESASPAQLQSLVQTLETEVKTQQGSSLWMKLLDVPAEPRNIFQIIWWWECRRLLYNGLVGLVGLPFAFLTGLLLLATSPTSLLSVLAVVLEGIVCYGIGANVCYCLGAPAELVARFCWKQKGEAYGPVLFTLGLIFSILLTIFVGSMSLLLNAGGLGWFHGNQF